MWMQSCSALSWLDDSDDSEVEAEFGAEELPPPDVLEALLLMPPDDVDEMEFIRFTVEDEVERMYAAE